MRLAYHTYIFGGRSWLPSWTLEEAIRITAGLGFEGLELAACRPHGWPWDLNQARRSEIRRLATNSGLAFSGICPVQVNHNIASPFQEEREATISYLIECLHLASDLDCPTIVCGGGWSVEPHTREEAWEWTVDGLSKIAKEAEHLGVVMALENINSRRADVVVTSFDITEMVENVGSHALKPMIDLYHLYLEGENPLEVINRLGSNLAYVHFLDAIKKNRSRVPPGMGEMPLQEILLGLRDVGYDGWLSVEIWGDDPVAIGSQSVRFFKEIMPDV
jgi:protein FrlC